MITATPQIPRAARILVLTGSGIALGTAAFHATGYAPLERALARADLGEFFGRGLPGLWLMFSLHLVALAVAGAWAAWCAAAAARPLLVLIAALLALDVTILTVYVGVFGGTLLLGGAAAAVGVGAALWLRGTTES
ncbi:MAG: hypothetical protein ACREOF_16440 [Gemmatimonadales bacterium]